MMPLRTRWFGESWNFATRLAVVGASVVGYAALFVALHPLIGLGVAPLAAWPAAAAGGMLGWRIGAATGFALAALDAALVVAVGGVDLRGMAMGAGLTGSLVVVAVGAAIGWMRDLAVRGEAQAFRMAELDAARTRSERRLRAILGVSRRLAAEPTGDRMLGVVLDEAARLLGADAAAVFRWDDDTGQLVRVRNTLPGGHALPPALPGEGVLGRAVAERRSVATDDYSAEPGGVEALKEIGVRAAAAAPLLEKGKLLGALWVGALTPERRFDDEDVATLELLASSAAAVLRGLDRARLEGVVLAARTAQHEVNNALTISLGYSELLARHAALPDELRGLAEHAFDGAMEAADRLQRLQEITEIVETPWGDAGPTIDLGPRETS